MTEADAARQASATLETAPTRYIEGSGIRFAYRCLGPSTGTPLVLLQHFSGNIDAWDPAVVNALAADRPVIAFDNAGVGRSTGQTPDNIAAMARDAVAFIDLLGLSEVDLLGFSLGGCVAQQIAAEHGRLVRKLILVGTAPKGGEEHLLAVLREAFSQTEAPDPRLPLFFTKSAASQSAGVAFLKRAKVRTEDRDTDNGSAVTDPQAKALIAWCATPDPGHATLRAISQPALVVSGKQDTMLPADNACAMFKALSTAQLILYPDSGHGALFQHHALFSSHVRTFLDA
jgi:pimeloyl-ACP methyl ester carboxylesterase